MKRYNINWTAKTLYNQMQKSNLNFDTAIQRSLVWTTEQKSLLIHSMLYGYAIPALYFVKNEEGGYDSLDGKQRSNAISQFFGGEFALDLPADCVVYDDNGAEIDVNGLTFDALPEYLQDRIRDYNLTIYYYEDMTEAEIREFFRRLNNGKALSAVELTRVKAKSIDTVQYLASYPAVQTATTDKGKARFADETLVMQVLGLAYMPQADFGTRVFRPWITDFAISDAQKEEVKAGLDYLGNFFDVLAEEDKSNKENARVFRKLKSKSHFVAAAYFGILASRQNMEQDEYNSKLWDFFNTSQTSVDTNYNRSVGSGSARADAVEMRKEAMDKLVQ